MFTNPALQRTPEGKHQFKEVVNHIEEDAISNLEQINKSLKEDNKMTRTSERCSLTLNTNGRGSPKHTNRLD